VNYAGVDMAIAVSLESAGIPLASLRPDPRRPGSYVWAQGAITRGLASWRDGKALIAATGHGLDCLIVDPNTGGTESLNELAAAEALPAFWAVQASTADGKLYVWVQSLGVETTTKLRGIRLHAGTPAKGFGRCYLPPTAGHVWAHEPKTPVPTTPATDAASMALVRRLAMGF
jgi:hypothetical protein